MTLVIQHLRDEWKKSDFQLTAEQLTELVPPILEEILKGSQKPLGS